MGTLYCVRHNGHCIKTNCCMDGLKPGELMRPTAYEGPRGSDYESFSMPGLNGPHEDTDKVYKPSHYAKWAIEPITFIMRNGMEFWRGNIIKYATRAGSKEYDGMDLRDSEITDLEKVRRYAEMRINQLKGEMTL